MRQAFKNKKTKNILVVLLLVFSTLGFSYFNVSLAAAATVTCPDGTTVTLNGSVDRACGSAAPATGTFPTETAVDGCAQNSSTFCAGQTHGTHFCGDPKQQVQISFDIGCTGKGNPIIDAVFAIIRFLSLGVGLIIVGSITFAGIQYTASRGDPKATADAIGRIRSNVIAFLIFIFAFAILNFVIPEGFIK